MRTSLTALWLSMLEQKLLWCPFNPTTCFQEWKRKAVPPKTLIDPAVETLLVKRGTEPQNMSMHMSMGLSTSARLQHGTVLKKHAHLTSLI